MNQELELILFLSALALFGFLFWLSLRQIAQYLAAKKFKLLEDEIYDLLEKEQFLAFTAHELKSPITSIVMALDLIIQQKMGKIPEKYLEYLELIKSNIDEIQILNNELLSFLKNQQNKIILQITEFDIKRVLNDSISLTERQYASRNIKINLVQTKKILIKADKMRFRQIMNNLLSNSMKYSKQGSTILVSVSQNENQTLIELIDHGIGMTDREIAIALSMYGRASKEFDKESHGIGLNLVHRLVEMHGWSLDIQSKKNEGTVFRIAIARV